MEPGHGISGPEGVHVRPGAKRPRPPALSTLRRVHAERPPTVAGYINGMREEDGPQKLREYLVAVFARGYCMGSLDTMRDSQLKNSKP